MSEAKLPAGEGEAWLSALQAVMKFRAAGGTDPMALAHWAEEGLLRARAGKCQIEGEVTEFVGWPDIPPDFWHWIYQVGEHNKPYVQWEAGVFATMVYYDPQNGLQYSDRDHWRLSRVMFNGEDLERLLSEANPVSLPLGQPIISVNNSRSAGKKPRALHWEKTAAAMAVLVSRGEFKADVMSDNQLHAAIDTFLTEKGHDEGALGVDTIRGLMRRYAAWSKGERCEDDYAE